MGRVVEVEVKLREPNPIGQKAVRESKAKRKIVRAGRRGGKTVIAATMNVERFLLGRRELYAVPTSDQLEKWWFEVKRALQGGVEAGIYYKNETEHLIEKVGTENRIRGKTAWNADTLRGDYADDLTLDEIQMMNEDAFEVVGLPMLLDKDGDALLIYTPPSLHSAGVSKAKDPRWASKLYKKAMGDTTGRWEAFTWTSHDNPNLSQEALKEIIKEMSATSYRQEILAQDEEIELNQLVYGVFNESLCKTNRFPIPDNWVRYSGHDFGSSNPSAVFLTRVKLPLPLGAPAHMRPGDFVVYSEYLPGGGYSPAQHVEKWKELTREQVVEERVGGSHQEEEVRVAYRDQGWMISEPKIQHVKPGIDRVKGWMEANRIFVFNDLVNLLEEIMNYLWKLDSQGKPSMEILDKARFHLCLVGDTLIKTARGDIPIEQVTTDDFVLTRDSYKRVTDSGMTNENADVVEVMFSDGSILRGTPDHPIFVKGKGFVPLDSLRYYDIMEVWKEKQLSTMEQNTIDTRRQNGEVTGCISGLRKGISIVSCGKMLMAKYTWAALSTIKTSIHSIMNYLTLNVRAMANIWQTTCRGIFTTLNILPAYVHLQSNGMVHLKGLNGIESMGKRYGKIGNQPLQLAYNAGRNTRHPSHLGVNSVPGNAGQKLDIALERMMKLESARFVARSSLSIDTQEQKLARDNVVRCLSVKPIGKAKVYNLTVDRAHEYYANGILVSNCDALRYIMSEFEPETVMQYKSNPIKTLHFGR